MIVLIDNYDSFTFNLFHYLGGLGADVVVHRNDKISTADVIAAAPDAIVLSPGPCTPNEAGICLDLIAKASATIPILGVCLGHQAIGQALRRQGGARAGAGAWQAVGDQAPRRRRVPRHQRAVPGDALSLAGGRSRAPCRPSSAVVAETDDRLVMGVAHTRLPVHGVQFHPESIASEHGHLILKNFLDIAAAWNAATGRSTARKSPTPPRGALRGARRG